MEMSGRRETGTVRACLCRAVYRLEGFLFYKIHFLTLPCLRIQDVGRVFVVLLGKLLAVFVSSV